MLALLLIVFAILFCFTYVLFVGPPYLPTLTPQIAVALELADLKPGQTLIELGCGDGKVLIAAAKQGINGVGYELNPIMAFIAWARTRRYRGKVQIVCGNFWNQDWPKAEAIFTFLLPKYMGTLNKKCMQYNNKPVKLISFAFPMTDVIPDAERDNVYRYIYK